MRHAIIVAILSGCAAEDRSDIYDPSPAPQHDAGSPDSSLQCTAPLHACGGACVDFLRDPNNCGECGHSCLGAPCHQYRCDVEVIAQGQNGPATIVSDGPFIY